jgi:hypothetical protein
MELHCRMREKSTQKDLDFVFFFKSADYYTVGFYPYRF